MELKSQDRIEAIKIKSAPILKSMGVLRSSLFGSVARGEADVSSDVDILVELPLGKSLLDLVDIKLRLEEALGSNVDIVTFKSIFPRLRDAIEKDAIPII